jgi:GR25 family glycosyltransferase involved in LPS biosynthesis
MISCEGYYINLEVASDRLHQLTHTLAKANASDLFSRFEGVSVGIDNLGISKGALGCLLSHRNLIAMHCNSDFKMIIEDDILLSENGALDLRRLTSQIDSRDYFDILFLGHTTNFSNIYLTSRLLSLRREVERGGVDNYIFLNARGIYKMGAFAYLLRERSKPVILDRIDAHLQAGRPVPIDCVFSDLIDEGILNAKIIFPHIFGVRANFSSQIRESKDSEIDHHLHELSANLFVKDNHYLKETEICLFDMINYDRYSHLASLILYKRFLSDEY